MDFESTASAIPPLRLHEYIKALKLPAFNKETYRTVVCALLVCREKTCREFIILPVIVEAVTAFPFPAARLIGAIAVRILFFHLAFHKVNLLLNGCN